MKSRRSILLVTPVKDEADHLELVIDHVVGQSEKPALWVMVDDHSTDGSTEICLAAAEGHPWIRTLSLKGGVRERQLDTHVYEVQKAGFEYGVGLSLAENIEYEYVGLLDADMLPGPRYYESLIELLEKDPQMGIVSGGVYVRKKNGSLRCEESPLEWPRGGARLLTARCFEEIGGIAPVNSGDAVSAIRAMELDYKVGQFKEVQVVQVRETSSAAGLTAGFFQKGIDDYFLGYSTMYAFAKGVKKAWDFSPVTGSAYFLGYAVSRLKRRDRIDDPIVRSFCANRLRNRIGVEVEMLRGGIYRLRH